MNTYLSTMNKTSCFGCLSCVYSCPVGAISIEKRFDKFAYPQLDSAKCINCNQCKKICPYDNVEKVVNDVSATYALRHKNDDIKKNSSSGGAFTAFSDLLISDDYKIYGAVFDENYKVHHIGSYSVEDRNRMRTSKYVESSLENIFPEIKDCLDNGEKVFFTGTPCQVAGLKSFLGKSYDNLITMDLICGGVTSPRILEDTLNYIGCLNQINYVTFTDKTDVIWTDSKRMAIKSDGPLKNKYVDSFYTFKNRSLGLRTSCGECSFAISKRPGDITVGDFWSIDWILPEFNEPFGVSFVAINTDKGKNLLNHLYDTCCIAETNKKKTVKTVLRMNSPVTKSYINDMFWKYYQKHSFDKVINIYGVNSLYSKLRRKPFEFINKKFKK